MTDLFMKWMIRMAIDSKKMTRGSFFPSKTIRPENCSEIEKSPKGESVSSSQI